MEMIVKNVKRVELNKKIANAALDIKTLKMIYQSTNIYVVIKSIKKGSAKF